MAHNVEPMDIDNIESDFDNKENSIHHSNVYPRTPCTEKGYEELDVSELNMKLRYSITPAASPMSKSFTANCVDNRSLETGDDTLNVNLTRSLHSAFSKGDNTNKSVKTLPLQTISSEQLVDGNRNTSVLRQLDSTITVDGNVTVTVTDPHDMDENISFPSSSSSTDQTPEATTPTKEIHRNDGGSPIMRGLKSVLNMFRSSQSPIPQADNTEIVSKQVLSPADTCNSTPENVNTTQSVLASTPIAAHKLKDGNLSKRSSPHKESIVFNEDLEKELLWKDETTILFSQEKIPIHKLFFQQTPNKNTVKAENANVEENLDSTVEYMDISYNDSMNIRNKTLTELQSEALHESDGEFVDCETTFSNENSGTAALQNNEKPDNEENKTSTEVLSNTTNADPSVPAQIHESLKTKLQPDTTVTLENKKENNHQTDHSFETKEVENNVPVSDEIVEITNNMNTTVTTCNMNEGNVNLTVSEVNLNNDVQPVLSEPSQSNKLPFNATFEHCNVPAQNVTFISEPNIVNSTMVLCKSNVDETNVTTSQDVIVSNSTFVQQVDSYPVVSEACDTTYDTKCENTTFVKDNLTDNLNVTNTKTDVMQVNNENTTFVQEVNNVLSPSDERNTTTVITPVENTTYVKKTESVPDSLDVCTKSIKTENVTLDKDVTSATLHFDDSYTEITTPVKDATFVQPTPMVSNESNKTCNVGYNSFVEEIRNDPGVKEKVDTSTPSTETDIQHSPENVPLPEDDVESVKSLGASIIEENIIPIVVDICNTTSVMKLENENNVEDMPMDIAKSIELLTEFDNNDKIQIDQLSDKISSGASDFLFVQNDTQIVVHEPETKEKPLQGVANNINESIIVEPQIESYGQQSTEFETKQNNLDNSIKQVMADSVNVYQPVTEDREGVSTKGDERSLEIPEMVVTDILEPYVNKNITLDVAVTQDLVLELKDIQDIANNDTFDVTNITNLTYQGESAINPIVEEVRSAILDEKPVVTEAEIKYSESEQGTVSTPITDATNVSTEIVSNTDKITTQNNNSSVSQTDGSSVMKNEIDLPISIDEEPMMSSNKVTENNEIVLDNESEKIVLSENNSPFVSVAGQINSADMETADLDRTQNPFATKSRVVITPPGSPKIVSKGYNFNFDEIDDPFATKTKIRVSPTIESPNKTINTTYEYTAEEPTKFLNKNRRKSQPERKRPVMPKNKFNSTFSGPVNSIKTNDSKVESLKLFKPNEITVGDEQQSPQLNDSKTEDLKLLTQNNVLDTTMDIYPQTDKSMRPECLVSDITKEQESQDDRDVDTASEMNVEQNKSSVDSNILNETKTTSSSEQSTYFSASTSSGEVFASKNVFNIPEIDDMNFNPFVTKSKMRQSPPPEGSPKREVTEPAIVDANKNDFDSVESISPGAVDDKEGVNVSDITISSKETDERDITVREIHTEDEDTEEGPFLETDDHDKMSDFDGDDVDMMQFSELPPRSNDENLETGEMFIDAEAFEFLLNQNKSNVVSDSGKESLFLKFDPLFAKRVSTDGVLAALNKVQKRQSTPKKTAPKIQMDSTFAFAGPSTLDVTHEIEPSVPAEESAEDLNVTVSKPMMVVTPAVNPIVTPRNKTITPTSSNRRSITFTSPAIAVIDRLLSLSANNSLVGHDTTVTVSREQNEADLALTQLRELLAEKEINVYTLRSESKELKDRLSTLESQMRTLECESEKRLRKVNELNEKLTEKTKINKSMAAVVEEYERTIASLIAETEQDKKRHNEERIKLINERDEQTAHLASMEVSFSDLHSKYEKSKQIILTCKANEDSYKKSIKEFEENLSKMQSNYELLKQHATSKLNHANQELEKMNRAHESEVLKMNAMIKRKELHITSLEETLTQKTKANEELTAICDELINKVG